MRRLVALLVIAVLGATFYGLSNNASGISVNGSSVSGSTFRSELAAIATNATLNATSQRLDPASFAAGAGGASMNANGAAAWANLRVEGLAIEQLRREDAEVPPRRRDVGQGRDVVGGRTQRRVGESADSVHRDLGPGVG